MSKTAAHLINQTRDDIALAGARLANRVSWPIRQLGRFAEARALLLRARAILENLDDPDHPDLATSYNNLAGVEQALGNLAEAIPDVVENFVPVPPSFSSDGLHVDFARRDDNDSLLVKRVPLTTK